MDFRKQILQRSKLIALALGVLFLIPPDTSFDPDSDWYVARNPGSLVRAYLFDIPLSDPTAFPIGSEKLTTYLSSLNSKHHSSLVTEIEKLFRELSNSQAREKLQLVEITHQVGQISQSGRINQILLDQVEKYLSSNHLIESEISRLSLQYYMKLEIDSQMKRAQINRVVSTVIHQGTPPEKEPCSAPDFFVSKPECEKRSHQPCRLAALVYDTQSNVCWKPFITESLNLRKDSTVLSSANQLPCQILAQNPTENTGRLSNFKKPIRKCRLNYFHSLLEHDQFSWSYLTNCDQCIETLINDSHDEKLAIKTLFQKIKEDYLTWTATSCHGQPHWNHEIQNGHNFSIEEVMPSSHTKFYFGYSLDQCSIEITRTNYFKSYF